ncbi:adenylyl-sulfate kinase [Novispirillum itersonii]|uniref:adenylyl-sulfate kinase n=1 Tax=Novispirillum itersonii TaxID=189 RepID=UPI00037D7B48|nr:adenylyl-sulfate kinase [Novispirillum itersonii]
MAASATTPVRAPSSRGQDFPIVIVGHVDHGKSTLIGRLLNDTDSLPNGKVEELRASSVRRGVAFEWSFVMDALQVERDQGITVDTTRIWFKTPRRSYVIIDAPGHKEFLKNMVTGAASARAAVLVVDVARGVSEQTRRHAYLLNLLGVSQIAVAMNKMDLVDYDQARYDLVKAELEAYLASIGLTAAAVVPVSAQKGDNLAGRSAATPWYKGPTVVEALDAFKAPASARDLPLRLPVQDVFKFDERRVVVGRVEAGTVNLGDELVFTPGGRRARVASFETWAGPGTPRIVPRQAEAGEPIAITLDQDIFVERGQVAALDGTTPAEARRLRVRVFWLGREPLKVGVRLKLKVATGEYHVTVARVLSVIDVHTVSEDLLADVVEVGGIGDVILESRSPVAFDTEAGLRSTRRGVLVQDYRQVGGVLIQGADEVEKEAPEKASVLVAPTHSVTRREREVVNGHKAGVLWLTGLSGSGKSTLAMTLQRRLFEAGKQVTVLDGDALRTGLSKDLDFTPEGRRENIRRSAEAARLLAESGHIVIVSLISPLAADRDMARQIIGEGFAEVYVSASLDVCEGRDVKGLYARARAGEIPAFTGVSAPYEAPETPDLTVDTGAESPDQSLDRLLTLVSDRYLI